MMKITVAICTWNRAALLDQTLKAFHQLRIPSDVDWELLVIDNNCTDDTGAVLARHAAHLPLRSIHEPAQGLAPARNRVVREASGSYILWTDDDVIVAEDWVEAYSRAFRSWPSCSIFGGPIEPWFAREPPAWLRRNWPYLKTVYGFRDFGIEPLPLDETRLPYGANYAIRAEEQRRYPYDTSLGRKGQARLGGEETTLIRAMLDDGCEGRWIPDARIKHFIPADSQSKPYVWGYFQGMGQTEVLLGKYGRLGTAERVPLAVYREYVQARLKLFILSLSSGPRWMENFIRSAYLNGVVWSPRPPCASPAAQSPGVPAE